MRNWLKMKIDDRWDYTMWIETAWAKGLVFHNDSLMECYWVVFKVLADTYWAVKGPDKIKMAHM